MSEPRNQKKREDGDPGVPEALPRTLAFLRRHVGDAGFDRLWIFPPLRRGRREWGLVAASCYMENQERRRLVTATYVAERTGRSLRIEPALNVEGDATPDLLPRVMNGVVRRSGEALGDPREIEVSGRSENLDELLSEFDPALFEPVES